MAAVRVGSRPRAVFFDFNLKYLCYVGLWSNEDWGWALRVAYTVYQITLFWFSIIYLMITGSAMYQEHVVRFIENIDKAIVAYNYFFKVIMFRIKGTQIKRLVNEILTSGDRIDERREKLMKYHVVIVTGMITGIIGGFQLLGQIQGEVVVDAWMPFDYTKNPMNLFLASQILAVLFAIPFIFRAIAIQGIVCSIVMYICDQLVELQTRLKGLTYSVTNDESIRKEFKSIIKKHIRLMGYSRSLKSVFKEYFLIQNLAITSELCLNALIVTIVGLEQIKFLLTFMAYLMVALFNAYIFCYLGQELSDQSTAIAYAAYDSPWTSWPVDMQKDLLMFITIAQKNFTLSAGGIANMSMETYARALYNGYSIFAVLRDVVD